MNKYILLKQIDTDSIPLGDVFHADRLCKLNDGSTIPLWRLLKEGYIKVYRGDDLSFYPQEGN